MERWEPPAPAAVRPPHPADPRRRARAIALADPASHHNHLLNALAPDDYARLAPHLKLVPMALGDVLYESGAKLRHVYFPTTSIISLLYVMENGASAEIAIVGNEGILGISLFMGGENDAEPRGRAERGACLSVAGRT